MNDPDPLSMLNPFVRHPQRKNFLMPLLGEINSNLERYYVIEQRRFVTEPFAVEAWEEARTFSEETFPSGLLDYGVRVVEFNAALHDVRDFEEGYSSSIEQKTRENAEILHQKKEALDGKLTGLRPMILAAQKDLRELIQTSAQSKKRIF